MNIVSRAASYLRRNGLRRSLRLLHKKATGRVPWNIRQPAAKSVRYSRDHERVLASDASPGRDLFGRATVAIIADVNLAQCRKYRVVQRVEGLESLGIGASFVAWTDVARCFDAMQTASHVMFYRLTDNAQFHAYVKEARRLGLGISYDIDDPVFDAEVYGSSANLLHLAAHERRHLVSQCRHYLAAMREADRIIVSTPALKTLAAEKAGRPAAVWRNGIDAETTLAAELAGAAQGRARRDGVTICYASGSRAHEADFAEAEPALLGLLSEDPNTRLKVIGLHRPSPALAAMGARVEFSPFTDYVSYVRELSLADINVVPLLQDSCNACKSAIRYLDAAAAGIPTVASRIGDFVNVIDHGRTGLLADGREAWLPALRELVADATRRRAMGEAARAAVTGAMSATAIAASIDPALRAELGP